MGRQPSTRSSRTRLVRGTRASPPLWLGQASNQTRADPPTPVGLGHGPVGSGRGRSHQGLESEVRCPTRMVPGNWVL